jgi:hypothetical protein
MLRRSSDFHKQPTAGKAAKSNVSSKAQRQAEMVSAALASLLSPAFQVMLGARSLDIAQP